MKNKYNSHEIEQILYLDWEKNDYFKPNNNLNKKSFCIIMPPPNITGNLHMGHAFQQTIMDILVRYHRMKGYNTLWQMGLDHAGIATQIAVHKKIHLEEKKNFNTISKKFLLKKCWEWKNIFSKKINYQIRRLGNSVDWSRERFTLDDNSINGVKKVFISLYNQKLIYKKKKLSNWDINLKTVISDLEVQKRTIVGNMWYIKYIVLNNLKYHENSQYLIVATTRPETLLGDVAIAVHPKDDRYMKMIGKYVIVPLVNRIIPIIADSFVDINKGTGCVKITPGHDYNDYAVAIRHNLPLINIFNKNGNICNFCDVYHTTGILSDIYSTYIPIDLQNLDRFIARKKIVNILMKMDLLDKVKKENITISYGDRSNTIIEPLLTDQWYLKTTILSKKSISLILTDQIKFFPVQYKNMYLSWMNNIEDWCISRQLWWGHKIPAWYDKMGNIYVGNNEDEIRKKYKISKHKKLIRDSDVLDTWFSSSLWTFLSLDWPNEKNLLNVFHPTTVLVSGFDIIFFWIARMIMMTMQIFKNSNSISVIPFKNVYITGLIVDYNGQKMSKSKGNVLDPIDIIDGISLPDLLKKRTIGIINQNLLNDIYNNTKKQFPVGIKSFGTDSLRFTFSSLPCNLRHIHWDMNKLQGYKNFCNKIWNAGRFIILNINTKDILIKDSEKFFLFFDIWILIEYNNMLKLYCYALDTYRFDLASKVLYNFIWYKFCDWYLEIVKIFFRLGLSGEIKSVKYSIIYIFERILRTAHPIIPFITEYIWKKISYILNINKPTIMLQNFPIINNIYKNRRILNIMDYIQKIIFFVRQTRVIFNIKSTFLISVVICNISHHYKKILLSYKDIIKKLGNLEDIIFIDNNHQIFQFLIMEIINNSKIFIISNIRLDVQVQLKNIESKINNIQFKINKLKNILLNKFFCEKSPNKIIIIKKKKLNILNENKKKLLQQQFLLNNYLNS